MSQSLSTSAAIPSVTIGLDLGDRKSHYCALDAAGVIAEVGTVATTERAVRESFSERAPCRVIIEVSTHSPWIARLLQELGHEVIVANPGAMYGARRRRKRNDRMDAEFLARQGRADVRLLHPIRHRGVDAQQHLELLRARDQFVRARTQLVNHVRGTVKSLGGRLPKCSTASFAPTVRDHIPPVLQSTLAPLLEMITMHTTVIRQYDVQIEERIATAYPDAQRLQQIPGVGPLTALAFVLLIDDPTRFAKSRDVGAYFGLVPALDESSTIRPQLGITKTGDPFGRRLLVSAAHYILGPFGPDCDLRRHGEALMVRGGPNAKKRAVIAVARKLAVLLHHLWMHPHPYDPNYRLLHHAA